MFEGIAHCFDHKDTKCTMHPRILITEAGYHRCHGMGKAHSGRQCIPAHHHPCIDQPLAHIEASLLRNGAIQCKKVFTAPQTSESTHSYTA